MSCTLVEGHPLIEPTSESGHFLLLHEGTLYRTMQWEPTCQKQQLQGHGQSFPFLVSSHRACSFQYSDEAQRTKTGPKGTQLTLLCLPFFPRSVPYSVSSGFPGWNLLGSSYPSFFPPATTPRLSNFCSLKLLIRLAIIWSFMYELKCYLLRDTFPGYQLPNIITFLHTLPLHHAIFTSQHFSLSESHWLWSQNPPKPDPFPTHCSLQAIIHTIARSIPYKIEINSSYSPVQNSDCFPEHLE